MSNRNYKMAGLLLLVPLVLSSCGAPCKPSYGACQTQQQIDQTSTNYSTYVGRVGQFGGYCPPYCAEYPTNSAEYAYNCAPVCGSSTSTAVTPVGSSNYGSANSGAGSTITTSGNGYY
jgi:hypothetical protein